MMKLMYILAAPSVLSTLETLRSQLVGNKLGGIASIAAAVAGILCAISMLKISHDYLNGHGITLWQVIRPIVLLIFCCNFNMWVLGPVHSVCRLMTNGMMKQANTTQADFSARLRDMMNVEMKNSIADAKKKLADLEAASRGEDSEAGKIADKTTTVFGNIVGGAKDVVLGMSNSITGGAFSRAKEYVVGVVSNGVGDFLRTIWERFMTWVHTMLSVYIGWGESLISFVTVPLFSVLIPLLIGLCLFIMKIVLLCQQISCYMTLIILSLLGPFAAAFSIMPGYESSLRSWLGRYVQVAFWIPVGQLVLWMSYWMLDYMVYMCEGYELGGKYVVFAALIISIVNITKVPGIAAYVIESAGSGGASTSVREAFQTIASLKTMGILKK